MKEAKKTIEVPVEEMAAAMFGGMHKDECFSRMRETLKQIVQFNDDSPACIVALDCLSHVARAEARGKESEKKIKDIFKKQKGEETDGKR